MFKVDGHPIAADDMDILYELKNQLALNNLDLLRKFKRSSKNIQFCCPIHKDGQEHAPSCGISTEDKKAGDKVIPAGTVHCFTCGYNVSLKEMVSHCFGYDDNGEFGKQWLAKNFMMIQIEDRKSLELNFDRSYKIEKKCYISEDELDSYRYIHPYLYQRKMTDEVIEKFDLGYDSNYVLYDEKGKARGSVECVTFPVRDETGGTLFLARRSVNTKFFHYPDGVEKPVYGLYELDKRNKEVIICESIFNALTCYVYGKPALALIGLGTEFQYEQLNKLSARKIILALDPDGAGRRATLKLKKALKNKIVTEYIIPTGKDINDLTQQEFTDLEEVY